MSEFSIMPSDPRYSTTRFAGSERHEVYEGRTSNRDKSIEDGLVVFLTPEAHRGLYGVHGKYGASFSADLKEIARRAWCDYYKKSDEDFLRRYRSRFF